MPYKLEVIDTVQVHEYMTVTDEETGKEREVKFLRAIKVYFDDGHWVTITQQKLKDEKGNPVLDAGGQPVMVDKFSVWRTVQERVKGTRHEVEIKPKAVFPAARWKHFERAYRHCGMPQLIAELAGIEAEACAS